MMAQAAYTVIFYLLSTVIVLLALAVVNERKLLRAAIALMRCMNSLALAAMTTRSALTPWNAPSCSRSSA